MTHTINDMPSASAARLESLASIQKISDIYYCEVVIPHVKACIEQGMYQARMVIDEPYVSRIENLLIDKGYRVSVGKATMEGDSSDGKYKLVIDWKKSQ